VDAPLFWFHNRNHKSNSKEKANSRFLHASYTFRMTKKDLLIGGWFGVSCSSTPVQCNSVLIIVYLLLNRLFFTNVDGCSACVRCGGWQRGPSTKNTVPGIEQLLYLLLVILIMLLGNTSCLLLWKVDWTKRSNDTDKLSRRTNWTSRSNWCPNAGKSWGFCKGRKGPCINGAEGTSVYNVWRTFSAFTVNKAR
jgi:hypothetical protein